MHNFKTLALTAALTALTAPAWAGLTHSGTGAYNLGSSSGPGGTVAAHTDCGSNPPFSGQDTLEFNGSGVNNIGIHAYSCDDSASNFGARASGENTYYAQGIASVIGTLSTTDVTQFAFVVNAGEVGAFGSTAFTAGEFQKSLLTIKLVIDGTTYLDEAWSAEVGTSGTVTESYTSNGSLSVGSTNTGGAGYFSFDILGGSYAIDLASGDHDISYVMTSTASGNILTTNACTAVLYGGALPAAQTESLAIVEGPGAGAPFASYCGAGARSGDPFSDPIARPFDGQLPEPMSAGLALTALLAAAGVRRRTQR